MTTEDKIEKLARLSERNGYITYDEINGTFPDSEFSPEELEKVYVDLLFAGAQIIEQGSVKDSNPEA